MRKSDVIYILLNVMIITANSIWFNGYISLIAIMLSIFAIVLLFIDIYIFRPTKQALQEYLDLLNELINNND